MIKHLDFFAKVHSIPKWEVSELSYVHVAPSLLYVCSALWKKLGPFFFKISTDQLFFNLKSRKINYCFGKKVWKKSWILDLKICAKPVFKTFIIHHCCFRDMSFQERKIICSSAKASKTDNALPFIIINFFMMMSSLAWIILLQCNFPFLLLFCRMMLIT